MFLFAHFVLLISGEGGWKPRQCDRNTSLAHTRQRMKQNSRYRKEEKISRTHTHKYLSMNKMQSNQRESIKLTAFHQKKRKRTPKRDGKQQTHKWIKIVEQTTKRSAMKQTEWNRMRQNTNNGQQNEKKIKIYNEKQQPTHTHTQFPSMYYIYVNKHSKLTENDDLTTLLIHNAKQMFY